jgi:voltage-gated potassium channel
VRRLWRDRRFRSLLGLAAILVVYFCIPVESGKDPRLLAVNIFITAVAVAVVALVVAREFKRMTLGEELRFTGGQLLIALEIVMVVFSLTYYSLAIYGTDQMSGLETKVDALYFTATTIGTVGYGDIHSVGQLARVLNTIQIVFDVVFIAAFVRLISTAATVHAETLDEERAARSEDGRASRRGEKHES